MQKIKLFIESEKGKDVLTVIIVMLVGVGSFELGRLSKENASSGVQIQYPDGSAISQNDTANALDSISKGVQPAHANQSQNPSGKNFFASSRGKKYYTLGCSAGKTIKQENRIYFTTSEEAEKAGYALSASCD
jgi:hypothetical protein